jgi:DHA1 family bicyclomycin/chloramphenicol resistance-like MFS transporter
MIRFAVVLGVMSACGPLAIDMYLPALPSIARDLHATQSQVESSMMSFFLGLTLGQPIYGPLSDRFGRRPPLLFGLLLYTVASAICALAPNVMVLIVGRGLQGLGAGAAIAISAAVIRDRYTGHDAARLLALRILVLGASPIVAPMLGASLVSVAPWQSVFWFATAFGVLICGLLFLIPETRLMHARLETRLSRALHVYGRLLGDKRFMGPVLCTACIQFASTAYIAGSAFVFIHLNHTPPWLYGTIFATNAIGFIGCAQLAPRLMKRFPPERLLMTASCVQSATALIMFVLAATGHATVPALIAPLFLFLGCYGLMGGPAVVLALRDHGAVAGTASALLSFLQWGSAALGSGLVALLADGTARPMTEVMAGGSLLGLVAVWRAFGGKRPGSRPEPVAVAAVAAPE